jgi:antitoxin VapB
MPLYIKDNETAALFDRLAKSRGLTKQAAVKLAVTAELERAGLSETLHERLKRLRAAYPLPPATGLAADKAFFDELSGDL